MFERFRRTSGSPAPHYSLYGKLPLDREFLRFDLDSPQGRWLTNWVDGAHQIMAGRRDGEPDPVELRALLGWDGGEQIIAALLRPSRDGGGRSYPMCIFCVLPSAGLRDQWYLSPIWAEPIWTAMTDLLRESSQESKGRLEEALAQAPIEPRDLMEAESAFAARSAAPLARPWATFTGKDDQEARSWASTLAQLGGVQQTASGDAGAVAIHIPVDETDGVRDCMDLAVWLKLFGAVSGGDRPWPGCVEARRATGSSHSLYIFGRTPTDEDLAHLLDGGSESGIDDVREAWPAEPAEGLALEGFQALLNPTAVCLADLWRDRS